MKEKIKKHLKNSLKYIEEIGNFCLKRKESDICKALYRVSSNFDSTATLFTLLLEKYDTLKINAQDKSIEVDPYQQTGCLIIDQSRFTFVATMSILEFTAKEISLKNGLPIKKFLENDPKKKNKEKYYLRDIMYASALKKIDLIAINEKKEWDFFIDIRNALVHNNAIVDKDLEHIIYGKLYSFKKGEEMSGDIQSLFIFSRRVVELFYDWSQKHENSLRS